jgi:hypothetical protein
LPETIRVKTPAVSSVPSAITGFGISANFETVMFYFDPVNDIDLDSYAYQLYDNSAGTGTPVASGRNKANVFTISVTNSTDSTPKTYYGRVAVVNTAGTPPVYTDLVSSGTTPLIGEQYISSLTAAKITAGTIGAHEITLGGATSIIKSSTYNFASESTTSGWYISGDGHFSLGGANGITYDNETIIIGEDVLVNASFAASSISVPAGGLVKLNINGTINGGVGGMTVGDPTYNYWYANGLFSVGSASKYFKWDGTNITTTGQIITNATQTGGTIAGINAGTNKLYIGAGNHANADTGFYVDSSGNFSLKNKLYWTAATNSLVIDGSVTIGSQSATAISDAVTTANNAATAASNAQATANGATTSASLAQATANGKISAGDVSNHIGGTNVTTISGGRVTTGAISSVDGTCQINLDNGSVNFRNKFILDSAGNAYFAGNLSGASGSLSAGCSIGGSLTIGDNVRINDATGDGGATTFKVRGNDNSTTGWASRFQKLNGTYLMEIRNDGRVNIPGSLLVNGNAVTSDIKLKRNIKKSILGLNFIKQLNPVSYNMMDAEGDFGKEQKYGLIAQEVKSLVDNLDVSFAGWVEYENEDKTTTQALDYNQFLSPIIKAIQELSAKVDQLESRLI